MRSGWKQGISAAAAAVSATGLICLALAGSASAQTSCDLVASSAGSDSAAGTLEQPLRTAKKLVDSLAAGQTGCLRSGRYDSDDEIKFATGGVTLTSYPGERATLVARVWIANGSDGVTVKDLDLNGTNQRGMPSPTVNANDASFTGNDVTNDHTGICFNLGHPTYGAANRTLIADNRIHDCGRLPATNHDHGIYVSLATDTVIRDNVIYDNADRGIQLYPNAQQSLIEGNVIDGNGQGIIFSGAGGTASSNNVVQNNVITNSTIRDNIDSFWEGKIGTGNVVRSNCIGGGVRDDGDGGIKGGSNLGFEASGNLLNAPAFTNAAAGDFSLPPSSPCAELLRGEGGGNGPSAAVTIDPADKNVTEMQSVPVRGEAPGAGRVRIIANVDGRWRQVGSSRTSRGGKYRTRIRLRQSGRIAVKATAGGLRDSKPAKLRVTKLRRR